MPDVTHRRGAADTHSPVQRRDSHDDPSRSYRHAEDRAGGDQKRTWQEKGKDGSIHNKSSESTHKDGITTVRSSDKWTDRTGDHSKTSETLKSYNKIDGSTSSKTTDVAKTSNKDGSSHETKKETNTTTNHDGSSSTSKSNTNTTIKRDGSMTINSSKTTESRNSAGKVTDSSTTKSSSTSNNQWGI